MSNVISSNLLKYKVKKNIDGSLDFPKVFLMSRNLRKRGQIYPIEGLNVNPKFKESNECSFAVYKENNGVTLPLFERIKDNCIIKIEGYGLYQIKVSLHETDTIYKEVTGTEMQACELSQCKCTLEINTEDDTDRGDYDKEYPTVFYRTDGHTEASLLHRALTYAPTYSIGYVDPSLRGINRKFSCSNSTVYDFFQDVASEIGCIFVFTPDKREINVFDAEDHCTNPKCSGSRYVVNGVCQKCHSSEYIEHGYGLDASTFLSTENLLEETTDTIDADSIKNCFKLVAGDDETTNLIGQRLIGGSPYIWTFSDFEIDEFSDELKAKWKSYQPFVDKYQTEFNTSWDTYNDCVNQKLYWMSGKMPVVENPTVDTSNPMQSCKNIFDDITSKITYTAISSKKAVESTVASQVLNYAKLLCPEGYEVSYQVDDKGNKKHSVVKDADGVITSFTSYIYICLKNCKDEQDSSKDKYFYKSDAWTIPVKNGYDFINQNGTFTTDYFLYMKQQLDYAYAKLDITYQPKYDTDYDDGVAGHLSDPDYYKNYFREYGIQRLTSFKEAYDQCTVSLLELNSGMTEGSEDTDRKYVKLNGVQSAISLYEELSGKYIAFSAYISEVIAEYTKIYDEYESKRLTAKAKIDEINSECNLKTYLGDELYHELLTFKREDTYENKNYSSDVVDESTLMENIEEFLIAAKNQIAKACQPQHEITVKMAQLLTLSDYDTVFDAFAPGNYVRSRVNGEVVQMRVISIPIDFENIEQSDITFSDTLVGNAQVKSMQEQFQKAASLATSFDFVEKQSERNDQKVSSMSKLIDDGLDATKNMIMNSENQDVVMDTHGILGRELDLNTNTYMPEQYRLASKGLIFTDNNWDTIRTALGKIYYNGAWTYGLIADTIVGKLIAGENLEIGDKDGSVSMSSEGVIFDGGAITWKTPVKQSAVDGLENDLQNINDNIYNNAQNLTNYKKEISAFQTEVDTQLSIAGVTKIDSTYVYSPKIASGYLYISKDGCSVQIDPSQSYDAKNDKVIDVKANKQDVFYIKRNGDGYFKGDVAANSLTLNVGTNSDGKNYLNVSKDGLLTARNAIIYGTIYATDGEFTGKVTATSGSFINGTKNVRIDDDGITLSSGQSIHWEKDAPVSTIKEEYLLSTSATTKPLQTDSNWSTTTPSWVDGKYMWKKTTTIDTNGTSTVTIVCMSGATGQKGQDGNNGKDGQNGKDGASATTYYLQSNVNIVKKNMYSQSSSSTLEQCLAPSNITFSLYSRTGTSATSTAYAGRMIIQESTDGSTWTTKYTSSSNESSKTYTISAKNVSMVKCTMYVANGTSVALDIATVPIVLSDNIVTDIKQYNLSTSNTTANGSWIDKQPTWTNGRYVWTRTYLKYESGYETTQNTVYDDGLTKSLQDFTTFKNDTDKILSNALPYTVVGEDYIISPKIGGGYLNITNSNYRVEINPNNTNGIFSISKKSDNTKIMGIDARGDGYFTGRITADSGKIGNWNIINGWLRADDIVFGSEQSAGISWGTKDNDDSYAFSLNGTNMEMSKNGKLSFRLNNYSNVPNTTQSNCFFADFGYISLNSSGNCVVNSKNFAVTSDGTLQLGGNEFVCKSLVLTAETTVVTIYLPAENINCTMPVSVCNGDGESMEFDLTLPTILPSQEKIKVVASNLNVGTGYRVTYSYWKQI